ncbi:MAG: hypothetical protein ACK5LO_08840 [Leucobacter sp.]
MFALQMGPRSLRVAAVGVLALIMAAAGPTVVHADEPTASRALEESATDNSVFVQNVALVPEATETREGHEEPLVPLQLNGAASGDSYSDGGSGGAAMRATPIACKITQDNPHMSSEATNRYTVNTHMTGKCAATPTVHTISGSSYRSEWFGWGHQKSNSISSPKIQLKLVNPFGCTKKSTYNYRTEARYYSKFANGYTGISYRTTTKNNLYCDRGW